MLLQCGLHLHEVLIFDTSQFGNNVLFLEDVFLFLHFVSPCCCLSLLQAKGVGIFWGHIHA